MISLHEPRFSKLDEELILQTLRTSWVSTGGPFVDEFETEFAKYVGSKHAVSVANGTLALHLAIEGLKRTKNISGNFDVLVPTLSFVATANSVLHAGGTPVLVDTCSNSMNIDPKSVQKILNDHYALDNRAKKLINRKTSNPLLCIMPAHIMGWCCDMAELAKVAAEFNLDVIDDAAEALGSTFHDGRHLGTSSFAATFSFNGNKILTTGGGGMIVTDNDAFAKLLKHLSTTAKTDNLRYVHDQMGYNYRMVNILAALGVSQLRQLPGYLSQKTEIFNQYKTLLGKLNVAVYVDEYCKSNHWIVNAVFSTEALREKALGQLVNNKIQARPLWTPAHKLPYFSDKNTLGQTFINAEDMWKRSLSLPSSSHLTQKDLETVVSTIRDAIS